MPRTRCARASGKQRQGMRQRPPKRGFPPRFLLAGPTVPLPGTFLRCYVPPDPRRGAVGFPIPYRLSPRA